MIKIEAKKSHWIGGNGSHQLHEIIIAGREYEVREISTGWMWVLGEGSAIGFAVNHKAKHANTNTQKCIHTTYNIFGKEQVTFVLLSSECK